MQHASTIRLDGEMNIYRAHELKETLMRAVAQADATVINLSDVTEIDSVGIQLLMLAKRQARRDGKTLSLVEHSPAVIDAIELMDLAAWFDDPIVVPARGN